MKKISIVIASFNNHKIKEISHFFNQDDCVDNFDFIALSQFTQIAAKETANTFIENALIKARYASSISNLPALADDSGLCLPILDGDPGIRSARYAGLNATDEQNNRYLLQQLKPYHAIEQRRAYYIAALVLLKKPNDPDPIIAINRWQGHILFAPKGTNGFGYDPLFYLTQFNCSVSQLSLEQKNKLSHRAKSLQSLKQQMMEQFLQLKK